MLTLERLISAKEGELERLKNINSRFPNLHVIPKSNNEVLFISKDYSLAEKIEIVSFGSYGVHLELIHFTFPLFIEGETINVYCRHDGWEHDDKRFAERYFRDQPYETLRHNLNDLMSFYESQKVKLSLLNILRSELEKIYLKPTLEQQESDKDEWSAIL